MVETIGYLLVVEFIAFRKRNHELSQKCSEDVLFKCLLYNDHDKGMLAIIPPLIMKLFVNRRVLSLRDKLNILWSMYGSITVFDDGRRKSVAAVAKEMGMHY